MQQQAIAATRSGLRRERLSARSRAAKADAAGPAVADRLERVESNYRRPR
jgi:hypothetical protein